MENKFKASDTCDLTITMKNQDKITTCILKDFPSEDIQIVPNKKYDYATVCDEIIKRMKEGEM